MSNSKPPKAESVGALARPLQVVKSAEQRALTDSQQKLVEASVEIFDANPAGKDAAFITRERVLASLPHSNPGDRP